MVAGGDGLAALEVSVAGNDRAGVFVGAVEQRPLQTRDRHQHLVDLRAGVQAGVGGNLVVARAGGVEFRASRADAPRQLRLDVHVDVFQRGAELELARNDVSLDPAQAVFNLGELSRRQQSRIQLSAGVGDGARDVVREQTPVIRNGFAELLDE